MSLPRAYKDPYPHRPAVGSGGRMLVVFAQTLHTLSCQQPATLPEDL